MIKFVTFRKVQILYHRSDYFLMILMCGVVLCHGSTNTLSKKVLGMIIDSSWDYFATDLDGHQPGLETEEVSVMRVQLNYSNWVQGQRIISGPA